MLSPPLPTPGTGETSVVRARTPPEHYHSRVGIVYFQLGNFRNSTNGFGKSEAIRHPSAHALARYNAYYLGFAMVS